MKTTSHFRIAAILIVIASTGIFYACKKSNSNSSGSTATSNTLSTQADDQTRVSDEDEVLSDDAETVLNSSASLSGESVKTALRSGTITVLADKADSAGAPNDSLICDASVVVDTTVSPKTITITYNGTNCWGNRTRTGTVVISLPSNEHWRDVNAMVTISIQNLKITRISDNTSLILNGTKTITNVSGGAWMELANQVTLTHTVMDSLSVTFPNNAQAVWNVAKQRVFTYNNGVVISTTGIHTDGSNNTDVAEWGVNRFGTTIESLISVTKVIRQDCDFRLVSGQNLILRSDSLNSSITYGLDASGNETTCPGPGNYYMEIVWTGPGGRTYPILLPY
jgi:ElaB/YqjD/DUF883 family membrane-anchored ribosome-binding protein